MREKNEDLGKYDLFRVWIKQNFPGRKPFRMAEAQMKWWRGGPMSFFTQGMPNFKLPGALLVLDAIVIGLVYWLNQLCIAEVVVMDLVLLEKINTLSMGLLVLGMMALGWILLYLQTGTFGKFLTQIEPAIIRDLFAKETFATALRVIKRKRHYPRTRKRRHNGDAVREAIRELDEPAPEPVTPDSETGFVRVENPEPAPKDALDSLMEVLD